MCTAAIVTECLIKLKCAFHADIITETAAAAVLTMRIRAFVYITVTFLAIPAVIAELHFITGVKTGIIGTVIFTGASSMLKRTVGAGSVVAFTEILRFGKLISAPCTISFILAQLLIILPAGIRQLSEHAHQHYDAQKEAEGLTSKTSFLCHSLPPQTHISGIYSSKYCLFCSFSKKAYKSNKFYHIFCLRARYKRMILMPDK